MIRFITPEECAYARGLHEQGRTQSDIATLLGKTQSAISKILTRYKEAGTNKRRKGQGRKKITSPAQERCLRLQAVRSRFTSSVKLQSDFAAVHEIRLSKQTVLRRLAEDRLKPYEAAIGPKLLPQHRRQRLEFAREHLPLGAGHWGNVLFSDESRFCLYSNDKRLKVFRRPGERYAQCNFKTSVSYGGGSVMVWGGINLEAKTELIFIERLTADQYITEILQPHVVPFAPFIGNDFLFMHDNAKPHVARVAQEYLEEVEISVMDWPARSPDLNPIEHLWDQMGRKVRSLNRSPQTLAELKISLEMIWREIDQNSIRRLIMSMPDRCQAVNNARGGNTRF